MFESDQVTLCHGNDVYTSLHFLMGATRIFFFFAQKAKIASIILLSKRDLLSGSMAFFVGQMRGWL